MSLSAVRTYFRDRLDSLDYNEWTDGFNFDNIPETISTDTYHLTTGVISVERSNHLVNRFTYPVTIRVFFLGYNNPAEAIDTAISASEDILADILSPANRLGTSIKDVFPSTITVEPRAESNDNSVILVMEFNADIFCNFT